MIYKAKQNRTIHTNAYFKTGSDRVLNQSLGMIFIPQGP